MDPISAAAVALAIAVTGYIAWRLRRITRTQRRRDMDDATAAAMEARRSGIATGPSPCRHYDPELD